MSGFMYPQQEDTQSTARKVDVRVLSDLRAEGGFPRLDGERLGRPESMICVDDARIGARRWSEP